MSTSRPSPLSSRPTFQMASSSTMLTQCSQMNNTLKAPCLLDTNSADALKQQLHKVGLSSDNLLAIPEETPQVSNANRSLLSRPPPQPREFQPSKRKRNKRGRPNAPRQKNGRFKIQFSLSIKKTLTAMPTIPTTSEHNATLTMTLHFSPYENLPAYKNLSSVMNTNSWFITPSAVITTVSPYINVSPVISLSSRFSSSNTYSVLIL